MGRPRTPVGTFGEIWLADLDNGSVEARTWYRDDDGKSRQVRAVGPTETAAKIALKAAIATRGSRSGFGELTRNSSFTDLVDLWLEDLDLEDSIAESTRALYERNMRHLVMPAFKKVRVRLATGETESLLSGSTAFAVTSDGVEWAAKNVRTGIELAARGDDGVPRTLMALPPTSGYPLETVTEMASSDAVLAWEVAGDLHVLDRRSKAVTLAGSAGGVAGIDADGRAVAWTSSRDTVGTGFLLLDGRAYQLEGKIVEVAVAGDWLAWVSVDPEGSSLRQHLARIVGAGR
ncbi:hypothetical protein [Promicromonospora sp. NPDC050262]|uniref:hypothetical protein n=1 Tax=Promicromonospora sp. NPDC050262 TaxID=3155036 RepID=UPI0033D9AB16